MEGLPSSSQHNDNAQYEHRLAAVELAFKEHEHRFKIIDQKAEAVARETNKLRLVLYGVSEEVVEESREGEATLAYDQLRSIVPEAVNMETEEEYRRLGRPSSKPRPVLVNFPSVEEKHVFLKHAKTLRQSGLDVMTTSRDSNSGRDRFSQKTSMH